MSRRGATGVRLRAGRALLALLLLAAVSSVVWYRRLPPDAEPPPAGAANGSSKADMVTRDFRHVETRMDRTIWILEAERAEVFGERAQLTAVKITWYGEPGAVPVVVTSRGGRFNLHTRNANLVGAVRLERADGAVLETEQLNWDEAQRQLRAPRAVTITTPTFTLRGTGMVADIGKQWVRLKGRVNGEIRGGVAPAGTS